MSRQPRLGDRRQRREQLPDRLAVLEGTHASGDQARGEGRERLLGTLTRTQVIGGASDLPRVEGDPAKLQAPTAERVPRDAAPARGTGGPMVGLDGGRRERAKRTGATTAFLLPFIDSESSRRADVREARVDRPQEKASRGSRKNWIRPCGPRLQQGIADAQAEMKKRSEGGRGRRQVLRHSRAHRHHYMDRAMGVYMGIFGNVPQVSVYLSMPTDAAGEALDGSKAATSSRSRRASCRR